MMKILTLKDHTLSNGVLKSANRVRQSWVNLKFHCA